MAEKPSRIAWVDIARGLLILFMVLGHMSSPIVRWIYTFHIPAFFFISGYVTGFESTRLRPFFFKKFASTIIPYLLINLIYLALRAGIVRTSIGPVFYPNAGLSIKDSLIFMFNANPPVDLAGATWFLAVLFESLIIAWVFIFIIKKIKMREEILLIVSVVLAIAAFGFFTLNNALPGGLDLALIGQFFVVLGWYFKKKQVLEEHINHKYALPAAIIVQIVFVTVFVVNMNFPTRVFGNPFILIASSLAGIYILYMISRLLTKVGLFTKLFSYIGTRTVSILFFHFLAFRIFYVILYYAGAAPFSQLGELLLQGGGWLWAPLFVFAVGFSLLLDYLIGKWKLIGSLLLGKNQIGKHDWGGKLEHVFFKKEEAK